QARGQFEYAEETPSSMWRLLLIISMLLGAVLTAPEATAQDASEAPTDLAAMLVPPAELPEDGYQFARGGQLTPDDARYLFELRYALDAGTVYCLFDAPAWRQSFTGTRVLLSDRVYLLAAPLVTIFVTIHLFEVDDGATGAEALLVGS